MLSSADTDVIWHEDSRRIILSDNVRDNTTQQIIWALQELERDDPTKPINFFVNSWGGQLHNAIAVCDVMDYLQCEVNTYGVGKCTSAGALFLLAGTGIRRAYPNISIMLHEMSAYNSGTFTDMDIYHEQLTRIREKIVDYIVDKTGQDKEIISKDIKRDKWLNAEEALDYGIIDEIIGG